MSVSVATTAELRAALSAAAAPVVALGAGVFDLGDEPLELAAGATVVLRGAGPEAVAKYAARARATDTIPTDPEGAVAFWGDVYRRHADRPKANVRGLAMQLPTQTAQARL